MLQTRPTKTNEHAHKNSKQKQKVAHFDPSGCQMLVPHCPAQVSSKLTSTHTHSLWLEVEEGVSTGTHTAQAPALVRALLFWFVATELAVFIA